MCSYIFKNAQKPPIHLYVHKLLSVLNSLFWIFSLFKFPNYWKTTKGYGRCHLCAYWQSFIFNSPSVPVIKLPLSTDCQLCWDVPTYVMCFEGADSWNLYNYCLFKTFCQYLLTLRILLPVQCNKKFPFCLLFYFTIARNKDAYTSITVNISYTCTLYKCISNMSATCRK